MFNPKMRPAFRDKRRVFTALALCCGIMGNGVNALEANLQTRNPTPQEIEELLAFLPVFEAEGFSPVEHWAQSPCDSPHPVTAAWPVYNPAVAQFYQVASQVWWCDYDYQPAQAWEMLQDDTSIQSASIDQVKTMLTYCARGERFCDGHWGAMIEKGYVQKLLRRLECLADQMD